MDLDCICIIVPKEDVEKSEFQSKIAPHGLQVVKDLLLQEKPGLDVSEVLQKTEITLLHIDNIAFRGLVKSGPREVAKYVAYHALKIDVTKTMPGMQASALYYEPDNKLFSFELIACSLKITHWP